MPRRPPLTRRWLTALTWPAGVALTSWDYMWRSTPMHRRERWGSGADHADAVPPYPDGVSTEEVLSHHRGYGPLFHRRYRTRIRGPRISAEELMKLIQANPNRAAPTKFARFQKLSGDEGAMAVGDEYVVRMPGPWDGPVRVIAVSPLSFRLATLEGHLEAGQIEFRASEHGGLVFEIESWARSSDRLTDLLYQQLRMSKEVQLHMWTSFLEGVVRLAGGRMTGGVDIDTRQIEYTIAEANGLAASPKIRSKLAELADKRLNFDVADAPQGTWGGGWHLDDLCQALPPEPPGMPVPDGSWKIARRLMRSYAFADPSVVRAYYDPDTPLAGRNMLLKLQALGLVHVFVGVRVGEVYEETRDVDGRQAHIWGWNYRTLEGHVEKGEMSWEVWKWLDTGEVQFRVHAFARPAPIANPIIRIGFWLVRRHERRTFLESTRRRMRTFTELGVESDNRAEPIRAAAAALTARPVRDGDPVHDELARNVGDAS